MNNPAVPFYRSGFLARTTDFFVPGFLDSEKLA
ncbi:MAG: hypothetical protein A4E35_02415 [Methanoregula sp. PtaU1.Bin051]|nr:MAG: hypothetical protein A4E35_02415 [Methanoregula sp. PtaU1.Bin051]